MDPNEVVDNSTQMGYTQDQYDELQDRYYAALESGDDEKITQIELEINKVTGGSPPDSAPTPDPVASAEATGSMEEGSATETQPPSTTEGAPPAKDGGTPSNEATEAWLESLDPKVREIVLEKLNTERKAREYHEQKYKSDIGRITAYKDKYENERKTREQLEAKLNMNAAQPVQQPAATTAASNDLSASENAKLKALNERISSMKNTDPELADALTLIRDSFLEEIGKRPTATNTPSAIDPSILKFKEEFEQQKFELQVERERYELEKRVPGALMVIDYRDQKGWSPWLEFVEHLPGKLKEAAYEPSADNYEMLMPLYIQWAERYNAAHGYTQPKAEEPQAVDPRAAQVQASRQAKMVTGAAAAPVKSSPPPAGREPTIEDLIQSANGMHPDSPEYQAIQDKIYKIMEKEARGK
jgi:hypothetical protein